MVESGKMRYFRYSLFSRHRLLAARDGLPCKKDSPTPNALYESSACIPKVALYFQYFINEPLFVFLELDMLSAT